MPSTHTRRILTAGRGVALVAVTGFLLSSCSGGGADDATSGPTSDETSAPASASPSPTESTPTGPQLTEPGAELSYGDAATVVYEPDQRRESTLELTVTKATKGSLKHLSAFSLPPEVRSTTPYYVDVTVENVGEGNVGGAEVPLRGLDASDTLLPATRFTTEFDRCPSRDLPDKFGAGRTYRACLVFLAPDKGSLEGVSFRPDEEYNAIVWTGEVSTGKRKSGRGSR